MFKRKRTSQGLTDPPPLDTILHRYSSPIQTRQCKTQTIGHLKHKRFLTDKLMYHFPM